MSLTHWGTDHATCIHHDIGVSRSGTLHAVQNVIVEWAPDRRSANLRVLSHTVDHIALTKADPTKTYRRCLTCWPLPKCPELFGVEEVS